jgi:hypothetical protein
MSTKVAINGLGRIGRAILKLVVDRPELERVLSLMRTGERHGYPQYWPYAAYWAWGAIPLVVPPDPQIHHAAQAQGRAAADGADANTHLGSSEAVLGYHAQASDGLIGHVADFLFEEETWAIRHLVIDTHNWLPGKRVLVAPPKVRTRRS